MKCIDRLVMRELLGPWVFGVAMFTVLVMAGSYLFALTDFVVQGVPMGTVMLLTFLYIPGVMVKTFAMAVLLASLLSFGRLSGDSEIVAMRASGVSVLRMMVPVAIFSFAVAGLAFALDETVVPMAAIKSEAIKQDVAKSLDVTNIDPVSQPIKKNGKLVGQVVARDFSLGSSTLHGVTIIAYDPKTSAPISFLYASEMKYDAKEFALGGDGWRIVGPATLLTFDGMSRADFNGGVWPANVPRPVMSPDDILATVIAQLDTFNMVQIREKMAKLKAQGVKDVSHLRNLEFGYWNKIALPLAAFVYGLLGAPLGIRNHRTGAAAGFALSIALIFTYMMLVNVLNVYARGGLMPPYVASFTPIAVSVVVALIIVWRRNG